jgi:hypothetical protein
MRKRRGKSSASAQAVIDNSSFGEIFSLVYEPGNDIDLDSRQEWRDRTAIGVFFGFYFTFTASKPSAEKRHGRNGA